MDADHGNMDVRLPHSRPREIPSRHFAEHDRRFHEENPASSPMARGQLQSLARAADRLLRHGHVLDAVGGARQDDGWVGVGVCCCESVAFFDPGEDERYYAEVRRVCDQWCDFREFGREGLVEGFLEADVARLPKDEWTVLADAFLGCLRGTG